MAIVVLAGWRRHAVVAVAVMPIAFTVLAQLLRRRPDPVDDASGTCRVPPRFVTRGDDDTRGQDEMSRFEVDSARVAQASAAVTSSVGSINSEVDRMMRNLLDLQNSWKGQAASQFQHVVTDWRATQERVRQSLEEISHALNAAGQQYAEVEQANARMFAR